MQRSCTCSLSAFSVQPQTLASSARRGTNNIRTLCCLVALQLPLVSQAPAAKIAESVQASAEMPQGLSASAQALFRRAEQGDAEAQFYLGDMYHLGKGVHRDYVEAAKWWRKAAEQGLAEARHNLGNSYYNGEGVPEDNAEAVKWHRKAAELGDAQSRLHVRGRPRRSPRLRRSLRVAFSRWTGKMGVAKSKGRTYPRATCHRRGTSRRTLGAAQRQQSEVTAST